VLIVDGQPIVQAGLRAILASQSEMEVVGGALSGAEAIAQAAELRPDVVVMDLHLGPMNGQTAIAGIKRALPSTRILVLTTVTRESDVLNAIEAGATGYLLKDVACDELLSAVRATARGDSVVASPIVATLMATVRVCRRPALSAREIEVLTLLARGGTNKQVARQLHLTEATIKSHLIRIYSKLGVEDRTGAVTAAIERGLVDLGTTAAPQSRRFGTVPPTVLRAGPEQRQMGGMALGPRRGLSQTTR
jgi:DNA-binding NarL/FixJ family response regulator